MGNFINFSNHPSSKWSEEQISAAKAMCKSGMIVDVAFPNVSPHANTEEVDDLIADCISRIWRENIDVLFVAGEFCVAFGIVENFKRCFIRIVSATTERVSVERVVDGKVVKESVFKFVQWRCI